MFLYKYILTPPSYNWFLDFPEHNSVCCRSQAFLAPYFIEVPLAWWILVEFLNLRVFDHTRRQLRLRSVYFGELPLIFVSSPGVQSPKIKSARRRFEKNDVLAVSRAVNDL